MAATPNETISTEMAVVPYMRLWHLAPDLPRDADVAKDPNPIAPFGVAAVSESDNAGTCGRILLDLAAAMKTCLFFWVLCLGMRV